MPLLAPGKENEVEAIAAAGYTAGLSLVEVEGSHGNDAAELTLRLGPNYTTVGQDSTAQAILDAQDYARNLLSKVDSDCG